MKSFPNRHRIRNLASPSATRLSTGSQRRRRSSSAVKVNPTLNLHDPQSSKNLPGASSGLPANGFAQPLPTIPGTPSYMSLSRSPSPRRGGGWATPGLTTPYDSINGRASPRQGYAESYFSSGAMGSNVTWASAKARSEEVNGYPSFSTQNNGFFSRHARQLSRRLPSFNLGGRKDFGEKEKLGRGRWPSSGSRIAPYIGRTIWRMRLRIMLMFTFVMAFVLFYVTRKSDGGCAVPIATDDDDSDASSISKIGNAGRRKQVCNHSSGKPRWRGDGMEGATGMGH